jgi:hypothetical protein
MGKKAVVKKAKDDDALAAAYLETESYINDLVMERSQIHTYVNKLFVRGTSTLSPINTYVNKLFVRGTYVNKLFLRVIPRH